MNRTWYDAKKTKFKYIGYHEELKVNEKNSSIKSLWNLEFYIEFRIRVKTSRNDLTDINGSSSPHSNKQNLVPS